MCICLAHSNLPHFLFLKMTISKGREILWNHDRVRQHPDHSTSYSTDKLSIMATLTNYSWFTLKLTSCMTNACRGGGNEEWEREARVAAFSIYIRGGCSIKKSVFKDNYGGRGGGVKRVGLGHHQISATPLCIAQPSPYLQILNIYMLLWHVECLFY